MNSARRTSILRRVAVSGVAVLAMLGGVARAQEPGLAGVWRIENPVDALRTVEGEAPPLTPDAQRIYRAHIAARKQGDTSYDSTTWCASPGMPRMMLINSPFEIVMNGPHVAFLHEWNWWARVVYLYDARADQPAADQAFSLPSDAGPPGASAPPELPPPGPGGPPGGPSGMPELSDPDGPMGISTGDWQGKALVVKTTNLRPSTLIDNSGLPHGDGLTITERLTLRGPDVLEERVRFEDPATFTRPWEAVVTYRRVDHELKEDVCLDRIKRGEPALQ